MSRWRARCGYLLAACALLSVACEWDPRRPLQRYAPQVDQALSSIDAGDAERAAALLAEYLDSNRCEGGAIAISRALRDKQHAGVDLSWVLLRLAERYGQRLQDLKPPWANAGTPKDDDDPRAATHRQCALQVARTLADVGSRQDRARAAYLEGNLLMLDAEYKDAIEAYDRALRLWPSAEGDDDSLGADAAYNRALALRWSREEPQEQDAGDEPDGAEPDGSDGDSNEDSDSSTSEQPDAGEQPDPDSGEPNDSDASSDDPGENDGGKDNPDGQGGEDDAGDAGEQSAQGNEQNAGKPDTGEPDAGEPDASTPDDARDGGRADPNQPDDAGAQREQGGDAPSDSAAAARELRDRLLDDLERAPTVQQEAARQSRRRVVRPEDDR